MKKHYIIFKYAAQLRYIFFSLILVLFQICVGVNNSYAQTYCFNAPQGYGAGATGGGNATPVIVTTQSALQSALTASGSGVVIVSGTITCSYMSLAVSNKTLLGLPGARLRNLTQTKDGSGILNLKSGSTNVIIRNLIFEGPGAYDVDGRDLLCIDGGSKIWVDHCEFQDGMDGNFDNKGLTDNITVSWCKFTYLKPPKSGGSGGTNDHRFSNLVGSSDSDKPSDGKYSITWQYCWWAPGCVERMTRARNAQLNMVSCLWNSQVAKVALGLGYSDCYVQNSVFANTGDKYRAYGGTIRLTTVGCTAPPSNVGTCPAPSYTAESIPASSVVSVLTGSCGAGATLNVTSSGAVSANSSCGGAPVNQNPTVSLTSPSNGATYTAPTSVSIAATAADADGTISSVAFYNGSTLLGTDASSPYSFTWSNVAAGTYSITARATDNSGAVTTSSAVSITVNASANQAPTVSLTSPSNGATYTAPASVSMAATAADADGTVSSVAFYNGSTLLGTDASSPYSFTWSNVASGTYSITARATDNSGAVTTSSAVSITVNASANQAPTVSLTSPSNGATYTAPASVSMAATAADADGTVSSVAFYNGSTLLGTDASSPYSFTWSNVAAGTYSITARATDNSGAVTTSSAVSITVTEVTIPPGSQVDVQTESSQAGWVLGFGPYSGSGIADETNTGPNPDITGRKPGTTSLRAMYITAASVGLTTGNYNIDIPWADLNTETLSTITVQIGSRTCSGTSSTICNSGVFAVNDQILANGTVDTWYNRSYSNVTVNSTDTIFIYFKFNGSSSDRMLVDKISFTPTSSSSAARIVAPGLTVSNYEIFDEVFPNPSNGSFTINASQGIENIWVMNMYGEELISLKDITEGNIVEVGRELNEGTFVMLVKFNSGEMKVAKLVKLK